MKQAVRGTLLSFKKDPFLYPIEECLYHEADGIVVMENGIITKVGPAPQILADEDTDLRVNHHKDSFILPGFIDCHVHYPQTEIIGAYGEQLIDWLNKYTFVAEQKYSDFDYAFAAAEIFLEETLAAGTTTASVFCTVDPSSVEAFFMASERFGMRNIAGKVLMDRHAPDGLLDTAKSGYDQSKALIEKWHGRGRSLYSLTPRFAPTSTREQMEATGALWSEFPGTYLQTHISENLKEIEWVKELYPEADNYLDVYDRFHQVGERAIFGHGIHLEEREVDRLHEAGASIAHCPTSNLFLGSGLFDLKGMMTREKAVRVGLATDLGGGTSFSQFRTMGEAYKIAQLRHQSISAFEMLYLATRGAARALYLDDTVGSLEAGFEADIAVVDLKATPLLEYRMEAAESVHDQLFAAMILAPDALVSTTYVGGQLVMERDSYTHHAQFHHPKNISQA
ncbi:MAG: guanine deaminase [Sneathiella sp.]|nr:guanine deaminase [Sneathiella sp.]